MSAARQIVVSAVIVDYTDAGTPRIILTQRDGRSDFPDHWESPGGKVKLNETDQQALIRECVEEIGVEFGVGPMIGSANWDPPVMRGPIQVRFYAVRPLYGVHLSDARPFPFIARALGKFTADEMRRLLLTPSNQHLVDVVAEWMGSDVGRRYHLRLERGK